MSAFGVEVVADSTGKFCGNNVRLATREEAERYGRNLAGRWTLVTDWRVIEVEGEPNYTADASGNLHDIKGAP